MNNSNPTLTNDYIISNLSGSIQKQDRTISITTPGAVTGTNITFNGNFGLGSFGSSYNTILRISDGSTTVDYTSEDVGGGSSSNSTKIGVGSDRPASEVVTELRGKINSSALNITATANSNILSLSPGSGATITVTEDPANNNSGNFGASSDFTTVADASGADTTVNYNSSPFRFSSRGAFNLRGQTGSNSHKTFLGNQKS